jgi:hypothetical protein
MKKIIVLSLLIVIVNRAYSVNDVEIYGRDSSYAGVQISFKKFTEQITNSESELAKCIVAKDGSFRLSFSVDEITLVFAYLGIFKVHLFAEPGKSYEILLPPRQEKEPDDLLNPYFSPTIVYLGTRQYNENELNTLIRMFSDAYQPYYSKHILEVTNKKDFKELDKGIVQADKKKDFSELDNDIKRMNKPFDSSNNKYFNDYRKYRYGLLRQLAHQQKAKSLSDEYFKGLPILYNNPAYMELFNQVYSKYFYQLSQTDEGKEISKNIADSNLEGLQKTLSAGNVLGNGELRDLVLLKGIYDEFYDDNYSRSAMLAILDSFIKGEKNQHLVDIARSIRNRTTKLLTGFEPPSFELYDRDSNLVNLETLKGKYVYLNFCSCYSYTCLNEFTMLNNLYQNYKDRLEIVTIIIDEDVNVLNSFLSRNNYAWKFLYFGHQSTIIQDYDIRAFPTYYLIDPQGKLVFSPAPSPGENFEARFFQLMRSRGEI